VKKALVTGADGFVGRYTLPLLVKAGFEVHALCWQRQPEPLHGVVWHQLDLMMPDAVDVLLEEIEPTHLLHLAWYTEHGKFWHAPENLDWVAASLKLLKSFVKHGGKRVVMAGSCAEYEWDDGHCSEQTTACKPSTLYGVSKHALHQMAESFCSLHNVSLAWGRLFFLYGPGEFAGRFVPAVINGLLRGETVACSDGHQLRDFMHVKDVAAAFVTLLASETCGAVNIASGEARTLREVGEELMRQINASGKIAFGALTSRQDDPAMLIADVKRLHDELDWRPSFILETGLADAIDWWKVNSNFNQMLGEIDENNN